MTPKAKNSLAIIIGILCGSFVNLGLVAIGMAVMPLPDGTDLSSMEAVRSVMKTLPAENFIFPLAAHALGTATGAYIVTRLAASHQNGLALCIGCFFFVGGLAMILNCSGPTWFIATDLLLSYFPMAYFASKLAKRGQPSGQV